MVRRGSRPYVLRSRIWPFRPWSSASDRFCCAICFACCHAACCVSCVPFARLCPSTSTRQPLALGTAWTSPFLGISPPFLPKPKRFLPSGAAGERRADICRRSEEHTSELQSRENVLCVLRL